MECFPSFYLIKCYSAHIEKTMEELMRRQWHSQLCSLFVALSEGYNNYSNAEIYNICITISHFPYIL